MADEYTCQYWRFICSCGKERTYVKPSVTSRGELSFEWTCLKSLGGCGKENLALRPLHQVIEDIPADPTGKKQKLLTAQSDTDFLKDFHIRMPKEDDEEKK